MSAQWKYSVGDVVYSTLTGRKMMVLDLVHIPDDATSECGYKLRTTRYKETFLYDFEITNVEPKVKSNKGSEDNAE